MKSSRKSFFFFGITKGPRYFWASFPANMNSGAGQFQGARESERATVVLLAMKYDVMSGLWDITGQPRITASITPGKATRVMIVLVWSLPGVTGRA